MFIMKKLNHEELKKIYKELEKEWDRKLKWLWIKLPKLEN